jgi:hypothetical protein
MGCVEQKVEGARTTGEYSTPKWDEGAPQHRHARNFLSNCASAPISTSMLPMTATDPPKTNPELAPPHNRPAPTA